jgi:hypothetical protein
VADAARRRKVDVVDSADFLRQISARPAASGEAAGKSDGISDAEARAWMRTFGFGEDPHETR